MSLSRRANQHSTTASQHLAGDPSLYWAHAPGERVMTREGLAGTITDVEDGLYSNETYLVTLDAGLGGGEYAADELRALGSKTAADDGPHCPNCGSDEVDFTSNDQMACKKCGYRFPESEGHPGGEVPPGSKQAAVDVTNWTEPERRKILEGMAVVDAAWDEFETHVASDDYPELGNILHDRPPLENVKHSAIEKGKLYEVTFNRTPNKPEWETTERLVFDGFLSGQAAFYAEGDDKTNQGTKPVRIPIDSIRAMKEAAKTAEKDWLKKDPEASPSLPNPPNQPTPEEREEQERSDKHMWNKEESKTAAYYVFNDDDEPMAGPYSDLGVAQEAADTANADSEQSWTGGYYAAAGPDDPIDDPQFEHLGSLKPIDPFHFTAIWRDVQAKAKRIREGGGVHIISAPTNNSLYITAEIQGDTSVYRTTVMRSVGARSIATWECGCNWSAYSWGRSGKWKRYEGRMCSHALALVYEAQSREMFGQEIYEDRGRARWDPLEVVPADNAKYQDAPIPRAATYMPPDLVSFEEAPATIVAQSLLADGEDPKLIFEVLASHGVEDPSVWIFKAMEVGPWNCPYCGVFMGAPGALDTHLGGCPMKPAPSADTQDFVDHYLHLNPNAARVAEHGEWKGSGSKSDNPEDPNYDEFFVKSHQCPWCGEYQGEKGVLEKHEENCPKRPPIGVDDIGPYIHQNAATQPVTVKYRGFFRKVLEVTSDGKYKLDNGDTVEASAVQHPLTPPANATKEAFEDADAHAEGREDRSHGRPSLVETDDPSKWAYDYREGWHDEDVERNWGSNADFHEDPEPALPSTDGEEENKLASLQAGLSWLQGDESAGPADSDIAAAAQEHLAKQGMKNFSPAEQKELIDEGKGTTASNLDLLQLEGTHYELMPDDDDDWMI